VVVTSLDAMFAMYDAPGSSGPGCRVCVLALVCVLDKIALVAIKRESA
jgi:hypothetical protein